MDRVITIAEAFIALLLLYAYTAGPIVYTTYTAGQIRCAVRYWDLLPGLLPFATWFILIFMYPKGFLNYVYEPMLIGFSGGLFLLPSVICRDLTTRGRYAMLFLGTLGATALAVLAFLILPVVNISAG